ncbi:uncharacterized protein [Montipora foliosa]|uniref:uncharacterized protein n=1 Tax=Montipora foliosa TaxID=591990 RepID=UPI0035F11A5A
MHIEKNWLWAKCNQKPHLTKSRTPAKRALSSPTTDANESIDETDTEKPSPDEACSSDGVNDISLLSAYSSQIICAVFFKKPTFSSLSVKHHLAPAAKELKIKHRGKGKYELALKIATELVTKKMIQVAEGANFKCLSRNEVLIEKELDVLSVESSSSDRIDSSSGSTMSVDETDSGPDYDYDDEPEQAD